MYFKKILTVIKYGSFSLPFTNFLIAHEKNNAAIYYLLIIKHMWNKDYEKSLYYIDEFLSKNTTKKGINYLISIQKLNLMNNIKNKDLSLKIYKDIRKNFDRIPIYLRPYIVTSLKNLYPLLNSEQINEIRTWSSIYKEKSFTKAFMIFADAKKCVNEKNFIKAVNIYKTGAIEALKYPHPTAVLNGYDFACWYSLDNSYQDFSELAEKLSFFSGYYYENFNTVFDRLYTVFKALRKSNDINTYKMSSLLLNHKENLTQSEYFRKRIHNIERFTFYTDKKSYKITKELISFFKSKSKNKSKDFHASTMSYITNKKVSSVKSSTLRKFIKSYNIDFKASNPHCINCEIIKMFTEDKFSFYSSHNKLIWDDILITYMSLDSKTINFDYLFSVKDDINKITDFLSKNYDSMDFLISVYEPIPFFSARKELIKKSLSEIKNKGRYDEFISFYMNQNNQERLLTDKFLRNYSRYREVNFRFSIKELFDSYEINESWRECMDNFAEFTGLDNYLCYTSFWCFDDSDRFSFRQYLK